MPISHKHKIIFIHIPKTGGTSIENTMGIGNKKNIFDKNVLFGRDKNYEAQHLFSSEIKKIVGKPIYNSYFKFSFVRNPFSRLVSDYSWSKYRNMNFEEFINKKVIPSKNRILYKDPYRHFKSQHKFIIDNSGKITVNFIGKFENLTNDFKKLCKIFNLKLDLPHTNKSNHKNYKQYYNRRTKNIVESIYKKDLELFNYNF